jgi:hypothetical protein
MHNKTKQHNNKPSKSISMDVLYDSTTQTLNESKSQHKLMQFKFTKHSKLKPLKLALLHNNNNSTTINNFNYSNTNPVQQQISFKTIDMIVNNSKTCKHVDTNTNTHHKMKPLLLNYHHLINIKKKRNNSYVHKSMSVGTGIQKSGSIAKKMIMPTLEVPHVKIHFIHKKDIEVYQRKLNDINKMSNSLIREKILNYYSKKKYGNIPTLPMLDNNKS